YMKTKNSSIQYLTVLTAGALLLAGGFYLVKAQAASSPAQEPAEKAAAGQVSAETSSVVNAEAQEIKGSLEVGAAQEIVDGANPFSGADPNAKVLQLPDGGFIIGTGTVKIFSLDDLENPAQEIDLDNNPNTMSVEEAYALWESTR
ncbi:MAG: hypothetical protein HUJ54_05825, partial [Erysipelotrichaceae bacterium]|nr:hypothetical protein [Erysipelotrichaceae bacterium]